MDEETRLRLFEPHHSGKNSETNFGLGMFVVGWIIKEYKGNIHIKSELDVGSEFSLILPLISN